MAEPVSRGGLSLFKDERVSGWQTIIRNEIERLRQIPFGHPHLASSYFRVQELPRLPCNMLADIFPVQVPYAASDELLRDVVSKPNFPSMNKVFARGHVTKSSLSIVTVDISIFP